MLHKLPGLTFLDSRTVSSAERKEAKRVGAFMRIVRPSDDDVSSHGHDMYMYIHACTCTKCTCVQVKNHSTE